MKTSRDIGALTEFDCYCCTPIIKCNVVGCATDYVCDNCPNEKRNQCDHIGNWCRPVLFSLIAEDMILKGLY